jgi:hypothetical protein
MDERSVRQNASSCIEVDKHTEQYGWGSASDLYSGNAFSDRDIRAYKNIYLYWKYAI